LRFAVGSRGFNADKTTTTIGGGNGNAASAGDRWWTRIDHPTESAVALIVTAEIGALLRRHLQTAPHGIGEATGAEDGGRAGARRADGIVPQVSTIDRQAQLLRQLPAAERIEEYGRAARAVGRRRTGNAVVVARGSIALIIAAEIRAMGGGDNDAGVHATIRINQRNATGAGGRGRALGIGAVGAVALIVSAELRAFGGGRVDTARTAGEIGDATGAGDRRRAVDRQTGGVIPLIGATDRGALFRGCLEAVARRRNWAGGHTTGAVGRVTRIAFTVFAGRP